MGKGKEVADDNCAPKKRSRQHAAAPLHPDEGRAADFRPRTRSVTRLVRDASPVNQVFQGKHMGILMAIIGHLGFVCLPTTTTRMHPLMHSANSKVQLRQGFILALVCRLFYAVVMGRGMLSREQFSALGFAVEMENFEYHHQWGNRALYPAGNIGSISPLNGFAPMMLLENSYHAIGRQMNNLAEFQKERAAGSWQKRRENEQRWIFDLTDLADMSAGRFYTSLIAAHRRYMQCAFHVEGTEEHSVFKHACSRLLNQYWVAFCIISSVMFFSVFSIAGLHLRDVWSQENIIEWVHSLLILLRDMGQDNAEFYEAVNLVLGQIEALLDRMAQAFRAPTAKQNRRLNPYYWLHEIVRGIDSCQCSVTINQEELDARFVPETHERRRDCNFCVQSFLRAHASQFTFLTWSNDQARWDYTEWERAQREQVPRVLPFYPLLANRDRVANLIDDLMHRALMRAYMGRLFSFSAARDIEEGARQVFLNNMLYYQRRERHRQPSPG